MEISEFKIKPISHKEIDLISKKCWDNRDIQLKILDHQKILGFAAWNDKDVCVGQLHCYSITLPDWDNSYFPNYAKKRLEDWPLGWPLLAAREKSISLNGLIWGIACFHVGLVAKSHKPDTAYFKKGLGKALLAAAVDWAKDQRYAGVIAHGGPRPITDYNITMGCLPWTSYNNLGFKTIALEENGLKKTWWMKSGSLKTKTQVENALAKGAKLEDLCSRSMLLKIQKN